MYFECMLEFLSPYRGIGSRIFRPVLCAFQVHVEMFCMENHLMAELGALERLEKSS